MKKKVIAVGLCLVLSVAMLACGSAVKTSTDLSDASVEELQERIKELEKENAELKQNTATEVEEKTEAGDKIRDLELTVVPEDMLPEELLKAVAEKKNLPFKFTFQDGGYLYICIGYGEQESGGYSITVEDLYLTENAIYVKTRLLGPAADVPIDGVKSYPYIVIKIEYLDYAVVFG